MHCDITARATIYFDIYIDIFIISKFSCSGAYAGYFSGGGYVCNRNAHRWGTRSVLTVTSFLFSSFTFSKRNIFDWKWKECDYRCIFA